MPRCEKRALRIEKFIRALAGNNYNVPEHVWPIVQSWGRRILKHYVDKRIKLGGWKSIHGYVLSSMYNWWDLSGDQRYNAARFLADRLVSKRLCTEEQIYDELLSRKDSDDIRV